jgi:hypothetical protein
MSTVATLHLCAVAFWFGVVGAEFIIERSRSENKPHGYAVARNHYWIDLLLEMPAVVMVLTTGFVMLGNATMSPALLVKIIAGLIAVSSNAVCVLPVALRKKAADSGNHADVIRYSRAIDRISLLGIPAGVIALAGGLILAG